MVSDPQRGLPLELSLTKLLFAKLPALQIIGMSATMGGEPVSCLPTGELMDDGYKL